MMTARWRYAYGHGLDAAQRNAQACEERGDCRAVTALQRPDFRTGSDVRKRHLTALGGLFTQVLTRCQAAGWGHVGHVALEGTTLTATASKHNAMNDSRRQRTEAQLAATVQGWVQKAATLDAREDAEYGRAHRGDELPTGVADKPARLETVRHAKTAREAAARAAAAATRQTPTGNAAAPPTRGRPRTLPSEVPADRAQRNCTDPESRIMKTAEGFVQGYNAQAAVDAASQSIVAQQGTPAPNDQQQLAPLVAQIKADTGRQAREMSADAGDCSDAHLRELNRRHITGYVATGRQPHTQAAAVGTRQAPAGARTRAMRLKLRRGGSRSRYRLRTQTGEPVFGQSKQARGFRQVRWRGLALVAQEWSLVCLAHNFLKLAKALA